MIRCSGTGGWSSLVDGAPSKKETGAESEAPRLS